MRKYTVKKIKHSFFLSLPFRALVRGSFIADVCPLGVSNLLQS